MILALNQRLNVIKNNKQRKAYNIVQLIIYTVAVLILMSVLFVGMTFIINQTRVTAAKQEMDTLKTAITSYQLLTTNPGDNITADDLKEGLSAEESIDGIAHENILPEDADLKDPWGGDYVIETNSDGSGSISTSNAVSVGGLDQEVTLSW